MSEANLYAFDQSGGVWNPLSVETSGGHKLQVDLGGGSLTTSVSGNVVSISGDTILTSVSGNVIVTSISGNVIVTSVSGNTVLTSVSGNVLVTSVSGNVINTSVSGNVVSLTQGSGRNGVFVTSQSGNIFAVLDDSGRLAVTNSGSAIITSVSGNIVQISGQVVSTSGGVAKISGETIIVTSGTGVRISGETISVTSGTGIRISGETIAIWGASGRNAVYLTSQSGNVAPVVAFLTDQQGEQNRLYVAAQLTATDNVSTLTNKIRSTVSGSIQSQDASVFRLLTDTTQGGSNLKTGAFLVVTGVSGGAALAASGGAVYGIKIKSMSGVVNAPIHVGSSGNPPYVSGGFVMDVGASEEFKTNNPAYIRVFARTSGVAVSWCGMDF